MQRVSVRKAPEQVLWMAAGELCRQMGVKLYIECDPVRNLWWIDGWEYYGYGDTEREALEHFVDAASEV